MKIAVLTKGYSHHKYFISQLSNSFEVELIVKEKKSISPPFNTYHPYQEKEALYEKEVLLKNVNVRLADISKTIESNNINDNVVLLSVKNIKPDIIIAIGTGYIKSPLIEICPSGFTNLHGGDPEYYRGVHNFLWTMYHKDFDKLLVTLHRVNKDLDDGDIIKRDKVKIRKNMEIFQFRSEQIKTCLDLATSSISLYEKNCDFLSKPQKQKGRYYSFMPSALKEIAINNFNKFISGGLFNN